MALLEPGGGNALTHSGPASSELEDSFNGGAALAQGEDTGIRRFSECDDAQEDPYDANLGFNDQELEELLF